MAITAETATDTVGGPLPVVRVHAPEPQTPDVDTADTRQFGSDQAIADTADTVPMQPVPVRTRQEAGDRLLAHLREHGGEIESSVREMAFRIGAKAPTLHTAIAELATAGRIAVESDRRGTTVRLVGAGGTIAH